MKNMLVSLEVSSMQVGVEIKRLRQNKGMTIRALAEKTGLSIGFISNVEHEINSPTISSLQRICEALDTDIVSFFKPAFSTSIVSRKGDCQHLQMPARTRTTCDLFPLINRKLQPSYITMDPGGYYGDPPLKHKGEEVCMVISGEIELTAGDDRYILEEGDCIYIESNVPHQIRNKGTERAKTIWVTLRNQ